MQTRYLQPISIGLIVVTLLALAAHRYALDTHLQINPDSPYAVRAIADTESGGNSTAVIDRTKGKLVLECLIKQGYEWPYCNISIALRKPPAGIDLTKYETVRLWIRSEGPEPKQQIRFFIRNFNPGYAKVDNSNTLKAQEILYDPNRNPILTVALSKFTVASWWTNENAIPVQYAGTEFDNVSTLEISTGGNVVPGKHRITVERIEFEGKMISAAAFRLLIIGLWLSAALLYLIVDSVTTRRQLSHSRDKQLSLKRINDALRVQTKTFARMAQYDTLTGLLNRNGLGDALLTLTKKHSAEIFPLSLIFIDIDHFKKINDQHGHGVGDQVIREFAEVIKSGIQRHDLIARWGGEEFLLICPLTKSSEAALIAERLRQIVSAKQWPDDINVTSSFGISELHDDEDLSEGIKRADEAMYRAKQNGRNRVEES